MPRERLAGLTAAQRAVGQLQSRGGRFGLEDWLPQVQDELNALVRAASGQGEVSDPAIDMALSVADAAASGRPAIGPAWSPAAPGAGARPPETYPGSGPGGPPPGAMYPGSSAPLPPSGGPTPYTLPSGYEAYSGAAAAGAGGIVACQTLRTAAGVSQSISDMVRAAECWTAHAHLARMGRAVTRGARLGREPGGHRAELPCPGDHDRFPPRTGSATVGWRPHAGGHGGGAARRDGSSPAARSVSLQVVEHVVLIARTPSWSVSSSRSKYLGVHHRGDLLRVVAHAEEEQALMGLAGLAASND